ncbi:hypothetical protein HMPREF3291_19805 [Bacillus sp. HMSC76G11]|nr:hypothetical protein HMPREF3291_19805 [Bacillus sp. HMSC76G11]
MDGCLFNGGFFYLEIYEIVELSIIAVDELKKCIIWEGLKSGPTGRSRKNEKAGHQGPAQIRSIKFSASMAS